MAIALVAGQLFGAISAAAQTTIVATFPSATTVGNCVILLGHAVQAFGTGAFSDSGGNTYTIDASDSEGTDASTGIASDLVAANSSTTATFTPASSCYCGISITEWTGVLTASAFDDAHNGGVAWGTTMSIAAGVASSGANLVIGGATLRYGSGAFSAEGFTNEICDLATGTSIRIQSCYKIRTESGTDNATWTWSGTAAGNCLAATYKPAAVAGRTTKNTDPWNLGQGHGMSFRMVKTN